MYWLTEDAVLNCSHEAGLVTIVTSQDWVRIDSRRVLVENDPETRAISGCPWTAPGMLPCLKTQKVSEGYSPLIRIDGRRVCLDTVTGPTNGTPQGTFKYTVRNPGQKRVSHL